MPDSRQHRGPHPQDAELFAERHWPQLQQAVADLSWLLTRGYPPRAALKLIGDHFTLDQRQRLAVQRCSCSDEMLAKRQSTHVELEQLHDEALWIDGFNVLTTVEAALSHGVLLLARDGCYRDMASMHGSYRQVAETIPAAEAIGQLLSSVCPAATVTWWLDRPVSNSGRLMRCLLDLSRDQSWNWQVELHDNPDAVLKQHAGAVATADSIVLDQCARWVNLARRVVTARIATAYVVPLAPTIADQH